jgi:hypothetical protein
MFDGRYPSMLLDALVPKLYQLIYPFTGPFLIEPVVIFLLICSYFLLISLIKDWFGSRPAALVTGGAWLLTSQTLLDSLYPIRSNMSLLVVLFLICLRELIRLRHCRKSAGPALILGAALVLAWFTHEYTIVFLPVIALVVVFNRQDLKRHLIPIAIAVIAATAIYFISLLLVLPYLAGLINGQRPDMSWMMGGVDSIFGNPAVLLSRFQDYVLVGLREMIRQTLGCGLFFPLTFKLPGIISSVILLLLVRKRGWLNAFYPFLGALVFYLAIAWLMFPVIPPSVEMPVYYYAPIIMLFVIPLGGLLSGFRTRKDEWRWVLVCCALLIIGFQNVRHSDLIMEGMPGDFGFNPVMRGYVSDILNTPKRISAGDITGSVYVAYPRPRDFDISRRWDIMLRVWKGESEQIFSMMMPVINLRYFENRRLIGSPEEFSATVSLDPRDYESQAGYYWDMPRRRLIDLKKLRLRARPGEVNSWRMVWKNSESREIISPAAKSLLGRQPRASLPPGRWTLKIPALPKSDDLSRVIVVLLRADLMPTGSEDVMNRVTPLPLKKCILSLLDSGTGAIIFSKPQAYGWSYQLFKINISQPADRGWELVIEGTASVEVVGPILIKGDSSSNHS